MAQQIDGIIVDDLLTWKIKVAAITQVYNFGGRVTLIDPHGIKWTVERRPEEALKQIMLVLHELGEFSYV